MDKNTIFNSRRYIILLIVVCLIFFVLVMRAFDYLPQSDKDAIASSENLAKINTPAGESDTTIAEENGNIAEKKKSELNIVLNTKDVDSDFDEIDAPPGVNAVAGIENLEKESTANSVSEKQESLSEEETAMLALIRADNLKKQKDYTKAFEEYQKVTETTNIPNITASGYEGMAKIHAVNKKYGTALSFAIKAFNMSPSSEREFLLAKLYYKTGDTYKASQRINNILRREFADDN